MTATSTFRLGSASCFEAVDIALNDFALYATARLEWPQIAALIRDLQV